ncbi:hypothetical protein [Pseudonocardia zijingensis]|jgi:hypothetical protein|uniref:F5/8 type C domain-containing protein n=1 Tax=Pseudonocardia zijingensis TaxID=153376 RepID=A0ABP4B1F8_9PSEU
MADDQSWDLQRSDDEDGWLLTNTSARPAKAVAVEFRGRVDGRPWREGVTINPSVLGAGEQTYIRIFRSDTVTAVEVSWRGRFGRRKRWQAPSSAW